MGLDPPTPPKRLTTNAMLLNAWDVSGDRVFFATGPLAPADLLAASSSTAGNASVLVRGIHASAGLAADSTGVYWYDDQRATAPEPGSQPAFIRKYTLATQQITDFANVEVVEFLHADGAHVVWTDVSSTGRRPAIVWSNTPDGAHPVALGSAPVVRQLATDGSSAYWAASAAGDDDSDIVTSSLVGGPTRVIACRVSSVYALAVDETDVYFSTALARDAPGKIIGKIPKLAR